jgi:hypothetical protein
LEVLVTTTPDLLLLQKKPNGNCKSSSLHSNGIQFYGESPAGRNVETSILGALGNQVPEIRTLFLVTLMPVFTASGIDP